MYTMKIEDNKVLLKNGSPTAKRATAVIYEETGKVFAGSAKAAKHFGVHPTTVSSAIAREKTKIKARAATPEEVKGAFKIVETPEAIMRPAGKNKGMTVAEKKNGSRCVYRVRDDSRIEYRKPDDKNWGIAVCCGKKAFRSLGIAEGVRKIDRTIISKKAETKSDGRRWATEQDVLRAWPMSTRVYTPTERTVVTESFMAVTWPDGQVTVRASVGTWCSHYASVELVPAGIMEAAKVLC